MKKAAMPSFRVAAVLLAVMVIAEAQQQTKSSRIAYLTGTSLSANPDRIGAFRQGLRGRTWFVLRSI
jgi:hypothetical protein